MRHALKIFFTCLAALYFILFAAVAAIRFIVLPHVNDYRSEISRMLSSSLGVKAEIGELSPSWDSFWPHIALRELKFLDENGDTLLLIPQAEGSVSWTSITERMPVFARLSAKTPEITVIRESQNVFRIAGFSVNLAEKSSGNNDLLNFLLSQRSIRIESAGIIYRDMTAAGQPEVRLNIEQMAFIQRLGSWESGLQGKLEANGSESPLDLRLRIQKKPLMKKGDWQHWSGAFYASADDVLLERISELLPENLPETSGRGSAALRGEFSSGKITALETRFRLQDIQSSVSGRNYRFPLIAGSLHGGLSPDSRTLSASSENFTLQTSEGPLLQNAAISFSRDLTNDHSSDRLSVSGGTLSLDALTALILKAAPEETAGIVQKLSPSGSFSRWTLEVSGDAFSPSDWSLAADFRDFSLSSVPDSDPLMPGIPGGTHLAGHLDATPRIGRIQLSSSDGTAVFPGIFKNPEVAFRSLSGTAFWNITESLQLDFRDIVLENSDLSLRADADWRDSGGSAGTISVSGRLSRGDVGRVAYYVPVLAGEPVLEWLNQALVSGKASEALVEWRGPIVNFPYSDGSGLFRVTGRMADASLDFLPSGKKDRNGRLIRGGSWPVVSSIDGTFLFEGARMVILAGKGLTHGTPLTDVYAEIPQIGADAGTHLLITGNASGNAGRMLGYLPKSPVSGWLSHVLDDARASGDASLRLALDIPFNNPEKTLVKGEVNLPGNSIQIGKKIPELTDSKGKIHFTQNDYWSDGLTASIWGLPLKGRFSQNSDGCVRVNAVTRAGVADARRLSEGIPELSPLLSKLSGSADAAGELLISGGDRFRLSVTSDLGGISSSYPVPLDKAPEESLPSEFIWENAGNTVTVRTDLGSLLHIRAELAAGNADYELKAVSAGLGTSAPAGAPGTAAVRLKLKELNLNTWQEALQPFFDTLPKKNSTSLKADIAGSAERILYGQRSFKKVSASAMQQTSGIWNARLKTDAGNGTLSYRPASARQAALVRADFDRLQIPDSDSTKVSRYLESAPAESFPSLQVKIGRLLVGNRDLGEVHVSAEANSPAAASRTWKLNSLLVKNSAAELSASGSWEKTRTKNLTQVSGTLKSSDTPALLKRLALPEGMVRGASGTVSADLSWKGTPQEFSLPELNGSVSADIGRGQFLQADPGVAGRFLSLISMQALLKRLTFDFNDVFGKGFAFDDLKFSGDIRKGVLTAKEGRVTGSAATIEVTGSSDLARQTIQAEVTVLPNIHAEGAALALAIANPIAGIGGAVAAYALKAPLAQMLATGYTVRGTFDQPEVIKKETFRLQSPQSSSDTP